MSSPSSTVIPLSEWFSDLRNRVMNYTKARHQEATFIFARYNDVAHQGYSIGHEFISLNTLFDLCVIYCNLDGITGKFNVNIF